MVPIAVVGYINHAQYAIGKTFGHEDTITQQHAATGVCLGDRDVPPGVVGGEEDRGSRSPVQEVTALADYRC